MQKIVRRRVKYRIKYLPHYGEKPFHIQYKLADLFSSWDWLPNGSYATAQEAHDAACKHIAAENTLDALRLPN